LPADCYSAAADGSRHCTLRQPQRHVFHAR
jgi:hypothetical protein